MFFRMMLFVWAFVLDVAAVRGKADEEKDLQILLVGVKKSIRSKLSVKSGGIPRRI